MSILVDAMKMPTSCADCFFAIKDKITMCGDKDCDYKVRIVYNCHFKPAEIEDGWVGFDIADKKRQEWCPLNEAKHGHWEYGEEQIGNKEFEFFECSVCKERGNIRKIRENKAFYCSHCGAKMDEEVE